MDLIDEDVKYHSNSIYESPIIKRRLDDFNSNQIIGEDMVFPHLNYPGDYGFERNFIIELLSLKALFRALKQARSFIENNAPGKDDPPKRKKEISKETHEEEQDDTVECENCNNVFNLDINFCSKCGARNSQKMTCSNCKKKSYNNNYFSCPKCSFPNPLKQKKNIITCPNCDNIFDTDDLFCNNCGSPNPEKQKNNNTDIKQDTVTCPTCNNVYDMVHKFCNKCGSPNPEKQKNNTDIKQDTVNCDKCDNVYDMEHSYCDKCSAPNPEHNINT